MSIKQMSKRALTAWMSGCFRLDYLLSLAILLLGASTTFYAQDAKLTSVSDPCPRQKVEYRQSFFSSGGKTIHIEQFQPRAAGKYPMILMIHGGGGLLSHHGTEMPDEDNFGEIRLACSGYVAVIVHYFDRSGILSTVDRDFIIQQAPLWLETLRQALDYVSSLPKANAARIGVLGESLGGYLALSLAMHDRRIKAVSEYAGGIQLQDGDNPHVLPPVLIQHAGNDSIVPVAEAFQLQKVLAANGVPYKIRIYQGLNHYPSSKARVEMEEFSIHFFDENLKHR